MLQMTSWFKSRLFLMWSNIANDYTTVHVDLLCTNGIHDFFSLNTEYNRKTKNNKWKNTWMSGVAGSHPTTRLKEEEEVEEEAGLLERPLDCLSLSWLTWRNHPESLLGNGPWLCAEPIDADSPDRRLSKWSRGGPWVFLYPGCCGMLWLLISHTQMPIAHSLQATTATSSLCTCVGVHTNTRTRAAWLHTR